MITTKDQAMTDAKRPPKGLTMDALKEIDEDDLNTMLERLAKKRDYAADVMDNLPLMLSYQQEIDKLVDLLGKPPGRPNHD